MNGDSVVVPIYKNKGEIRNCIDYHEIKFMTRTSYHSLVNVTNDGNLTSWDTPFS